MSSSERKELTFTKSEATSGDAFIDLVAGVDGLSEEDTYVGAMWGVEAQMKPFGVPLVLYLRSILLSLSDSAGYNRFTEHKVIVFREPTGEVRYGVERKK